MARAATIIHCTGCGAAAERLRSCASCLNRGVTTPVYVGDVAPDSCDVCDATLVEQHVCRTCNVEVAAEPAPGPRAVPTFEPSPPPSESSPANDDDDNPFHFDPEASRHLNDLLPHTARKDVLSRYRIVRLIAEGGMGKVLLVEERATRRYVAMKLMRTQLHRERTLFNQFVREAVITARLQHPNIIPVYELGFIADSQRMYYTMRFTDAQTFADARSAMSVRERVRTLAAAARAVHFAHENNLWHRDLKPHNILIGQHEDVYVIDWGLVSVIPGRKYDFTLPELEINDAASDDRVESATLAGRFIGTPLYMSPEQIRDDESCTGAVSDVWAFGVMLFEALYGAHPFATPGQSFPVVLDAICSNDPFSTDIAPADPKLVELCRSMLEKDPALRMPSLGQFVDAVQRRG
ncbi:MAG TPA: serine/threonine-protein kinase [Longimicrobiales bacterium]|nr:serine/threonine-protein kinase [Longimicrobiales bacterium]